ncbi:MAG: hypothetical protein ACAI25_01255 [Planctomycetota bacterium]
MSDEDLRALERQVCDAPSRIRYAEALARMDRVEDALRALLTGIEEPSVRLAAAQFLPRATPIEKEPRLLWEYRETKEDLGGLHVNGFAVVVNVHNLSHSWPPYQGGAAEGHEIHVLDPATGVRRTGLSGYVGVGLVDEVVIATPPPDEFQWSPSDGTVVGFDSRNGGILWQLGGKAPHTSVAIVGRQLVRRTSATSALAGEVEAFSLEDPRRPPRESVAHVEQPEAEGKGSVAQVGGWSFTLDDDVVIGRGREKEAWRFDGRALGVSWSGHLVVRGATLIGACRRGGRVFCLS